VSQAERWTKGEPSSLAYRFKRGVLVREWQWWKLPVRLRLYVAALTLAMLAVIGVAAAFTRWRADDLGTFALLLCCGMISVALTPRIMYAYPGLIRDFSTVWVIPIAILLPPVYTAIAPIPFMAVLQFFVHRGVLHRRVFTAASVSLPYAAVSVLFHWFPHSFAGNHPGTGLHALTWVLAVAACEAIAGRVQHFLVAWVVKITDPSVRLRDMDLNVQALGGDFLKLDLGVLITLAVALSPALVVVTLPLVFLVRRFLEHPVLVAQSRVDSKTGLLNVSTWEAEAEAELARSARTGTPAALALVDIDHFKLVNDTHGHLVGDRVLKALAEALTGQSRDYDRTGRFGGEEFVLLLAQTSDHDACNIAERLRGYVAALEIPVDDRPGARTLGVTISIGVTAMGGGESYELADLLAAADSAMYAAKQAGRNQVAFAPPLRDMGMAAAWDDATRRSGAGAADGAPEAAGAEAGGSPVSGHRVRLVRGEHTAASLCPRRSLSVPGKALPEAARDAAPAAARAPGGRRAGSRYGYRPAGRTPVPATPETR
jgi:diguanylate cyclase (GGDEF)-like protein